LFYIWHFFEQLDTFRYIADLPVIETPAVPNCYHRRVSWQVEEHDYARQSHLYKKGKYHLTLKHIYWYRCIALSYVRKNSKCLFWYLV
jgi:hypothetical protein